MISIDNVYLSFEKEGDIYQVLDGISFRVEKETSCAIIGPSGCGKSSLLFLLAGLLQTDKGAVTIEGAPRIGTILQNYGLFPWKTVTQNIELGLLLNRVIKQDRKETTASLLKDMGLEGFGDHYPAELSGGMQQRVALARALAIRPQILLMDEPLSSLDALTRERLQDLIVEIWQRKRITKVLVTHSIEEAVFLGQKIVILDHRPSTIIEIVDNPGAGNHVYRKTEEFFHKCTEVRAILERSNGEET